MNRIPPSKKIRQEIERILAGGVTEGNLFVSPEDGPGNDARVIRGRGK